MIISPLAHAELWVKHDNGTIETRYSGDCFRAGFCEKNNINLLTGWIEVDSTEFTNSQNKYYKVEAGDVVEMLQAEKDAVDAAGIAGINVVATNTATTAVLTVTMVPEVFDVGTSDPKLEITQSDGNLVLDGTRL